MTSEEQTVRTFYAAFAERDWRTMGGLYADEARFSDPVFPDLDAAGVRAMWRMLCERGEDLDLRLISAEGAGGAGAARWEARYTFSSTGRKVHNVIDAELALRDGRIVRHVDRFDFWRWSRQALGVPGLLLGWSPVLRRKVQATAARSLERFRASHDAG